MSKNPSIIFPTCTPVGFWRYPLTHRPTSNPEMDAAIRMAQQHLAAQTAHLPDPLPDPLAMTTYERQSVIAYLERADHARQGYCGWSDCRLCSRANGSEDVSDGVYVWPSGLVHYVRDHHVGLPPEFVAHVVARAGEPSAAATRVRGWVCDCGMSTIAVGGLAAISPTAQDARDRVLSFGIADPGQTVYVECEVVGGAVVRTTRLRRSEWPTSEERSHR